MSAGRTIMALMFLVLTQCSVTGQNLHTRSNRALKYYDQGKRDYELLYYDRAETNLLQALKEDGKFYEAHLILGQLYSDTGDWEKAVTHYRAAVAKGGDSLPCGCCHGLTLLCAGTLQPWQGRVADRKIL